MRIFPSQEHPLKGVRYWGEVGGAPLRINFGIFMPGEEFPPDPIHYHTVRTTYFCVLSGELSVSVDGKEYTIEAGTMLEILPMEQYQVADVGKAGCTYVVIGTPNVEDKVVL